jgi:hypothetical protein
MFFIPAWVSNCLLLATCVLSGYQHSQLRRANPVTNIQFWMIVFAMVMIVTIATHARTNVWLSLGFFIIAVGCLGIMIRQNRMLPPNKRFE